MLLQDVYDECMQQANAGLFKGKNPMEIEFSFKLPLYIIIERSDNLEVLRIPNG